MAATTKNPNAELTAQQRVDLEKKSTPAKPAPEPNTKSPAAPAKAADKKQKKDDKAPWYAGGLCCSDAQRHDGHDAAASPAAQPRAGSPAAARRQDQTTQHEPAVAAPAADQRPAPAQQQQQPHAQAPMQHQQQQQEQPQPTSGARPQALLQDEKAAAEPDRHGESAEQPKQQAPAPHPKPHGPPPHHDQGHASINSRASHDHHHHDDGEVPVPHEHAPQPHPKPASTRPHSGGAAAGESRLSEHGSLPRHTAGSLSHRPTSANATAATSSINSKSPMRQGKAAADRSAAAPNHAAVYAHGSAADHHLVLHHADRADEVRPPWRF